MFCYTAVYKVVSFFMLVFAIVPADANAGHELIVNPIYGNQPNLALLNVEEVCTRGVWVSYRDDNYQETIQIYSKLDYFCESTAESVMRSARFVGLEDNFAAQSVTLFGDINLAGEPITFTEEIPDIEIRVLSFVTINATVELFQHTNFGGLSICVEPAEINCDGGVCWTWRLHPEDFPWDITTANSARAYCSSTYRARQNIPEKGPNFAPNR